MKPFIVCAIFFFFVPATFACNCALPISVSEAFAKTETVLHACVANVSEVSIFETMAVHYADSLMSSFEDKGANMKTIETKSIFEIELEVFEVYKGKIKGNKTTIYTNRSGASCGYTGFEAGREYIVYAYVYSQAYRTLDLGNSNKDYRKSNSYWTNSCTRTDYYSYKEANDIRGVIGN